MKPLVSIRADLGSLSDEGLVQASSRFVRVLWYPLVPGEEVLIEDPDGPICRGRVVRAEGMSVDIEPDWRTFLAGARFSHVQPMASSVFEPERTQAAL